MLSYLTALLAACANAASSVLQRRANLDVPGGESLRPGLLWQLLHRPVWLAGVGCMVASFVLQATALASGELSAVQPLLVTELPLTLLLASRVFRTPLRPREWLEISGMTCGLAGVLYFLSPSAGAQPHIPWQTWALGVGGNVAAVAVAVWCGRTAGSGQFDDRAAGRRAACYGIAGGCQFALTAALMKGAMSRAAQGVWEIFAGWELYAMVAAGVAAVFLMQSALHSGKLLAAQPGLTLADPVVAILWGVLVFGERVRGGLWLLPAAAGAALLGLSVAALTRSPLLQGEAAATESAGSAPEGSEGG
jgi:drug/metabolite transporter (DMT)-like permease